MCRTRQEAKDRAWAETDVCVLRGSGWGTREEELLQIHKALCRGSQESGIWHTKEQIPRATSWGVTELQITDAMNMNWGRLGRWWGTGRPVCCSSWGRKESDMTDRLNWTELNWKLIYHSKTNRGREKREGRNKNIGMKKDIIIYPHILKDSRIPLWATLCL